MAETGENSIGSISGENSIGTILRTERLRQGKGLGLIAEQTKICRTILEAIENDRFDAMPGGAYRRSFLGQYASALGLDPDEAVAAFRRLHDDLPVSLPSVPKSPPSPHLKEAVLVLVAGLAVAGLYKFAKDSSAQYKFAVIGKRPAAAMHVQSQPATPSSPQAKASAPLHVVFTMTEPVWVSVSCDGKPTYTGTLSQAESRSFEASTEVRVLVGNAGGLSITLNGRPLGPIGGHGEIQLLEVTAEGTRRLPRSQANLPAKKPAPEA